MASEKREPITPAQALAAALEELDRKSVDERLIRVQFGMLSVPPHPPGAGAWWSLGFMREVSQRGVIRPVLAPLGSTEWEEQVARHLEDERLKVIEAWQQRFAVTEIATGEQVEEIHPRDDVRLAPAGEPVSFQPGGLTPGGSCRG